MLTDKCESKFNEYLETNSLCVILGITKKSFQDFPFHMQYGMIENFFYKQGIIIDRDSQNNIFKIWDYRDGEPMEPQELDYTYSDTYANVILEVMELANKIYNKL